MVKITAIKVHKSKLRTTKAYGHIEVEGELSVNFTVMDGTNGEFISWPGYKNEKDNKWHSYVFWKNLETKVQVEKHVMDEWKTVQATDTAAQQRPDTGSQVQVVVAPAAVYTPSPGVPF